MIIVQKCMPRRRTMGQRELRAAFQRVYGSPTQSFNNNWLRRKLLEGAHKDLLVHKACRADMLVPVVAMHCVRFAVRGGRLASLCRSTHGLTPVAPP